MALDSGAPKQEFIQEVLSQNWRLELDYGLGLGTEAVTEVVLLICSAAAAGEVLRACVGAGTDVQGIQPCTCSVLRVEGSGAEEGAGLDWTGLRKHVVLLNAVPMPGKSLQLDQLIRTVPVL